MEERSRNPAGPGGVSGGHHGAGDQDQSINSDQLADDHRLLIGAIICAPPEVRDRLFRMLQVGDLDSLVAADALEVLRALHNDGVTDRGDLVEQFAQTVEARRRDSRPGYLATFRYVPGPRHWLARAFSEAAPLGEHGAVVLAMQYTGTGRRRAIADAADRLARVARSECDDQAVAAMVAALNEAAGS